MTAAVVLIPSLVGGVQHAARLLLLEAFTLLEKKRMLMGQLVLSFGKVVPGTSQVHLEPAMFCFFLSLSLCLSSH